MYIAAKSQWQNELLQESVDASLDILSQLCEPLPVPMGDGKLSTDMQHMNGTLNNMSDETFFCMKEADQKKIVTLMKVSNNVDIIATLKCFHLTNQYLL